MISVIIPANNEEGYIGTCLDLLLASDTGQVFVEIKSVTLCRENGVGVFPDAVSDRARSGTTGRRGRPAPPPAATDSTSDSASAATPPATRVSEERLWRVCR